MHFDLIVIGLGLSGLMAAKTASEDGRKVLLVGRGAGSLCIFTGGIGVLDDGERRPLGDAIRDWTEKNPHHPYAKTGWIHLEASLASFCSLFKDNLNFSALEGMNSMIPTGAGTRRPAYLLPEGMKGGALARMEKTLIVGMDGFKDFYPEYVAHHLRCRGISVPAPCREKNAAVTAAGLATLMDDPSTCRQFAALIKKRLAGEEFIGLPAVLGLRSPAPARKIIEEETGCVVFEIPVLPPSIPGVRVFNGFKDYLIRNGVSIVQGCGVKSALWEGRRCLGITVDQAPLSRTYTADNFILATGRFLGGGLVTDENGIYEPIFGLKAHQPPARKDWFQRRFFAPAPHPIHQAGVMTDSRLRPVDHEGNVLAENLRVAGSILTHHDAMRELSREGVALATGYAAAKWAGGIP